MPIHNRLETYKKLYCNFRTGSIIDKKVKFESTLVNFEESQHDSIKSTETKEQRQVKTSLTLKGRSQTMFANLANF